MRNPNKFSIINPSKSPVFYGYIIVLLGTMGVWASLPGQTVGVSTFTDPVKDALGLTRNQFSNAYMIGTLLSSMFLSRAGVLFDKYGARWVAFFSVLLLSMALFLSSQSVLISDTIKSILNTNNEWIAFVVILLLFFLMRFSGQGVLTMVSRNMVMKWFDAYRGRANAFRSIAVSLGFSLSPLWINMLIDNNGWQNTWIYMSLGLLVFSIIVLQFFRDNPEEHGLIPDGKVVENTVVKKDSAIKQFTIKDAKKTRAFWMYSLILSFYSFFVTGLTFHIVSVFNNSGYTKEQAISIFLPISIISVIISAVANYFSDMLKLKLYLYLMITGGILASLGLIFLSSPFGIFVLVIGVGIMGAFFSVLNTITWPRFYGKKYLGSITGKTMSFLVFSSALAPSMFSFSVTYFQSYLYVGLISLSFLMFLLLASVKAHNPQ
jgi:MFS family permease